MKVICVDDEELVLNLTVHMCRQLRQIDDAKGFSNGFDALGYLKENTADIALLDIDMPEISGIELAVRMKKICPDIAVIFLTGYSHYALEAFKIHAKGYLLKPVGKEQLEEEITHILSEKLPEQEKRIKVKTFGEFDIFVDKQPLRFSRLKAKELLAFLVDKNGAGVSRSVAFAALYEDAMYDRKMQKQFDVIIRSLKNTLKENGVAEIFEMHSGEMRINPDLIECDLYSLLKGDVQAINSYRGEYMSSYPWASITEAFIERNIETKQN